ncbi:hypothetical protein [Dyella sp. RRB7]|uniref:hypothetical protein n=1 Tax=Dyella sp. RRB7 TaxID=2919502 RepID=UPI001FA991D1|nr:hypothetical protein [Dyella sp. RRB7]
MRTIIKHPAFEKGRQAVLRALDTQMRGQIIFVVGMSGVGKSEIRYDVMRSYAGSPSGWGTGKIPAIAVRAAPTSGSYFNSKEFTLRLYLALFEPDIGWVANRKEVQSADCTIERTDKILGTLQWLDVRSLRTEHYLRTHVERMIIARSVRAIFIDESASITYAVMHKNPVDHMVNLMCLAEETNASLVMFGVPRMASLWEGNAEIIRRSRFVFVDRYRYEKADDRADFERLAVTVARNYRFHRTGLVHSSLDMAYASSAGVFGELVAYYQRADDSRLMDGCHSIQRRHLEAAIASEFTLTTLHADARQYDALSSPASARSIERILAEASEGPP